MQQNNGSYSSNGDSFESLTYSVQEAAKVVGVSDVTIYRLIERGHLKVVPWIRHKRVTKKSTHELIAGKDE